VSSFVSFKVPRDVKERMKRLWKYVNRAEELRSYLITRVKELEGEVNVIGNSPCLLRKRGRMLRKSKTLNDTLMHNRDGAGKLPLCKGRNSLLSNENVDEEVAV